MQPKASADVLELEEPTGHTKWRHKIIFDFYVVNSS